MSSPCLVPATSCATVAPSKIATVGSLRQHKVLLAALLFISVLTVDLVHLGVNLDTVGSPKGGAALIDFRDAFYFPSVALLDGHNPYASIDYLNRYPTAHAYPLYSPASLLVHLPYAVLPYRLAQFLGVCVNLLALALMAVLALRLARVGVSWTTVFGAGALVLLSRPGQLNLFLGQCTFYVVAGVYVALLEARRRPLLSGLGLALTTIKPTIGLPLAMLMLARGDGRAVFIGLSIGTMAALAALVPLHLMADPRDWRAILDENLAIFARNPAVNPITSSDRTDLAALTARLVGHPLTIPQDLAVAAVTLGLAAFVVRRLERHGDVESSSALICLGLLVSTYHMPYDPLLLTALAAALLCNPAMVQILAPSHRWRWLSLGLLAVPAGNYLASGRALALLGPSGWWLATSATSVAAGLLFGVALMNGWRGTRLRRLHFPSGGRLAATGPVDWIESYDRFGPGVLLRRRLNWAADLLPENMDRVLEVGFGSGVFQYELCQRARVSVGVDIHQNGTRVRAALREDGLDPVLLSGDGTALPFRDDSFDAVVILSSLEFVPDATLCLRECRRVLRRGGRLVCVRPRQLPWLDLGFRLLMGSDPETEFAGGRARATIAVRETMVGARRYLKPSGWTSFLAPYEVIVFDDPRPRPDTAT